MTDTFAMLEERATAWFEQEGIEPSRRQLAPYHRQAAKRGDPDGDGRCPARGEIAAEANASVIQRDMS